METMLFTPEGIANPYPEYDRLRGQSPVRLGADGGGYEGGDGAPGLWLFLRYGDVYGGLSDHDTFSSGAFGGGGGGMPLVLINDDPPRHTRSGDRRGEERIQAPRTS